MPIIKIFEVRRYKFSNNLQDIELSQIVDTKLSEVETENLIDNLKEITTACNHVATFTSDTFFVINNNEQMQNLPLGEGVVIHATSFEEMEYAVVIQKNNTQDVMGVLINA